MQTRNRKLIAGITIILGGVLSTVLWLILTPCPPPSSQIYLPAYIESLWPPPELVTRSGCYVKRYILTLPSGGTGLTVSIVTDEIFELEKIQTNSNELIPFRDRVLLYVDGKPVPITRVTEGGGTWFTTADSEDVQIELAGWYMFTSNRFLMPGNHLAKIVINTTSGEVLEHEWRFTIK